jgi:hypothetical protein
VTAFTVLIPHKRNPGNDAALRVCLDCLFANTANDFHLLIDAATDAPLYERMNALVTAAPTDLCIMLSSDIFVAPRWDVPLLDARGAGIWVNGVVAEPGMIGVHPANVERDFGRTPDGFRRAEFEAWAASASVPQGDGWVVPLLFSQFEWLYEGGLNVDLGSTTDADGFPYLPADEDLIQRFKTKGGMVRRVSSFAYHLQRWSSTFEQRKGERFG